jgi:hypothetical protein
LNRFDQAPPQPLEITPLVWIALAIIALMGFARMMRDQDEDIPVLDYFQTDNLVVVRSQANLHVYPALGIKVALPDGWSYLTVEGNAIDNRPTFVNESEQSIVRLHNFHRDTWPADAELTEHQYGEATVQWIHQSRRRLTLAFETSGMKLRHQWIELDPRRIGRYRSGNSELMIVAVTHSDPSGKSESLETFCAGIQFLNASD